MEVQHEVCLVVMWFVVVHYKAAAQLMALLCFEEVACPVEDLLVDAVVHQEVEVVLCQQHASVI